MSTEEPTPLARLRQALDQPGPPPEVPTTVALRRALGTDQPAPSMAPSRLGPPRPLRREAARPFTYRADETSQAPRDWRECPESVTGHASGADGRCLWCERRVDPPVAAPRLDGWRTELEAEYRRHYDPDWGTGSGEL